jgi:hypothetical protein
MHQIVSRELNTAHVRGASYADLRVMDTRQHEHLHWTGISGNLLLPKALFMTAFFLLIWDLVGADTITTRIRGRVVKGESFESAINEKLSLRLVALNNPDHSGWMIEVVDRHHPTEDLARIVTPPYYGVNDCEIVGWHFRNSGNTGPNKGDVNAPQMVREFRFLLDYSNLQKARDAVSQVLRSGGKEFAESRNELRLLPVGAGKLRILELKLGNVKPGKKAWIQSMKFEIEFQMPAGSSLIP